MKFGLYSSIANPPRGDDLDRCVDEVIEEAQAAEAYGLDSCFFGEHHQDKDGFLPSPLIVATAVAARTTTLRVGTSVILLPLHHPVHLAEDVATLSIVSKGRIVLGVGLGYQQADFQPFGIPIENRVGLFEEEVEIIRRCWTGERFSYHGKYHDLENVQVLPTPYKGEAPALFVGASVPRSARRAGRLGDGLVAGPSTNLETTVNLVNTYWQAAEQAGRRPQVSLMRDAWVAETRQEAEDIYGPEVLTAYRYYWRAGLPEFRSIESEEDLTLDKVAVDRMILGNPEECIRDFHRWHEATGADLFLLRLRHAHSGGPSHQKIMETLKLLGEQVIPYCS